MNRTFLLYVVLIIFAAQTGWGQIPKTISFQGILTDSIGQPISGNKNLIFKIYDTSSGSNQLWSETQTQVTLYNGIFNVVLGSVTQLTLPFNKPYWIGVTIDTGPELEPRIQLTSSAYSLNTHAVIGQSNVFPSDGNVGIGTADPVEKLVVVTSDEPGDVGIRIAGGGKNIAFRPNNASTTGNLMVRSGDQSIIFHAGTQNSGNLVIAPWSASQNSGIKIMGANGNIGIGTPNPNHPLQMSSGAYVTAGGVWTNASSREYKENIRDLPVEEAMNVLHKLKPRIFNYKIDKEKEHVGFISEDVPELVPHQQNNFPTFGNLKSYFTTIQRISI